MKYIIIAFCVFLVAIEIAFPVGAVTTPPVDDIEAMLKKVEGNLRQASAVVSVAKAKGEALVESKVAEKAELKQAVAAAENQVQAMQQVNEIFAAKMIANGMDTSITPMKYAGPIYDAWLNYVEEGGTEEFDYFRMYLWEQK